jgi:pimeloyl-ACP methyl ester carboxylesterase
LTAEPRPDALYVEEAAGRPPPVVLLHHGAGSLRAWDAFVPAIAGGRRLLAYDRRGFGSSSRDATFDAGLFDRDAGDLAGLLEALAATPAHLVGHSDGATVALVTAYRHPDAVLSVTSIAGHVRADSATREAMRGLDPPATPEEAAWYELWTRGLDDWDIEEGLAEIRCPVLVVHDRRDPLAPPEHAEAIRGAPHARIFWYETGTHVPHRVERARFKRELEEHLREVEAQIRS